MRIATLIFTLLVLMASASTSERVDWSEIEDYIKATFNFFDKNGNKEILLILGDGGRNELSRFLMGAPGNQTQPTNETIHRPFSVMDGQTGVLIFDLPYFHEFRSIQFDITMAFLHKQIFEKAKALRILVVMPDEAENETIRFSKLAVKLVAILDKNLDDVSSAITLVGVKKPKKSEDKVQLMLKNVVNTLKKDMDFMKDTLSATYGSMSAEWIKHQIWWTQELMFIINEESLFAVFRRPGKNGTLWSEKNRKNLRELFFDTDYYANVYQDLKVIVDARTKDYFSYIDMSEFVNKRVLRRCTKKIVTDELPGLIMNSNITQLKLSYAEYVSKFDIYMAGAKYIDFCLKVKSDAKVWNKLKFELEKLDFFEQLKGKNSTLRDFGLDYSFVKETQQNCKLALDKRSTRT